MEHPLERSRQLLGAAAMERLAGARVVVVGLGGVGSHAAEALARGGVGTLVLVDSDAVALSNLNRQIQATVGTVGAPKALALAERLGLAAPHTATQPRELFVTAGNVPSLLCPLPDYVVDAVDNVSAKVALAGECVARGIPLISCMGTGNKLDPTRFMVGDIFATDVCPLCRVMRRELRRRGIPSLEVVWSDEPPQSPRGEEPQGKPGRPVPGSVSFVPPVAGLIAAGVVIRRLAGAP